MDSKPLKIPMVSEGAEKYFGTVWNLYCVREYNVSGRRLHLSEPFNYRINIANGSYIYVIGNEEMCFIIKTDKSNFQERNDYDKEKRRMQY